MKRNAIILNLVNDIKELCSPDKIILISCKYNTHREITSIKLCVLVSKVEDTKELEKDIYIKIDCEIPFDVIVYDKEEWEVLINKSNSYASKIDETGVILYE